MSYILNKYNGDPLTVLEDGTIDVTSSSIGLVGRNYVGYGEVQNENFIHILENFANQGPPLRPLIGQLWYDTGTEASPIKLLKVYNGAQWTPVGSAILAETPPGEGVIDPNDVPNAGSLWLNTITNTLYVYDGNAWKFVGPESAEGFGTTRAVSGTIRDLNNVKKPVIFLVINEVKVGIITNQSFTALTEDVPAGFSADLAAGINLSNLMTVKGSLTGVAEKATRFETTRKIGSRQVIPPPSAARRCDRRP